MSSNFDRQSDKVMYIFLIITVLVVSSIGYWVKTNGSYKTIVSSEDDFKFQVPKSWTVEYAEPNELNPVYGIQTYDDKTSSMVFVVATPAEEGGDAATDVKQLVQVYSFYGFKLEKEEDKNLNGYDGRYYEATLSDTNGQYYQSGFITYQNGKKYTLTLQVSSDNLEAEKSHLEKSLKSFKIMN